MYRHLQTDGPFFLFFKKEGFFEHTWFTIPPNITCNTSIAYNSDIASKTLVNITCNTNSTYNTNQYNSQH